MGQLKGYSLNEASQKKIEKLNYEFCEELKGQIAKETFAEKVLAADTKNRKVYFITKKKEVHGVVSFAIRDYKADDFVVEQKSKINMALGTKDVENVEAYELDNLYLTEDLKTKEDAIREICFSHLKEGIGNKENSKVKAFIWGDNVLIDNTIGKSDSSSIATDLAIGLCIGMALGELLFDNLALGMSVGMCIGLLIGASNYSIGKKREKTAADEVAAQKDEVNSEDSSSDK